MLSNLKLMSSKGDILFKSLFTTALFDFVVSELEIAIVVQTGNSYSSEFEYFNSEILVATLPTYLVFAQMCLFWKIL